MKYIFIIGLLVIFWLPTNKMYAKEKESEVDATIVCPSGWVYTCYMIGNGTVYKGRAKIKIEK